MDTKSDSQLTLPSSSRPDRRFDEGIPFRERSNPPGRKKTISGGWRDLESRFQSLRHDHGDNLVANWISTSWNEQGDQWYLLGASNDRERDLFGLLVEQAVVRLGRSHVTDALFFWLDLLREDSPSCKFPQVLSHGNADGTLTVSQALTIQRVIQASAEYCLRLETKAICEARSQKLPRAPQKLGRRPDEARKDAIRNAIRKQGDQWRDHLGDLLAELDRQKVTLNAFQNMEIDLGDGTSTTALKWDDLDFAEGDQRRRIVDSLRKYAEARK
jgi:hypothetical protein